MTFGADTPHRSASEPPLVDEDGTVRLDLTALPSREDVGLAAGQESRVVDRPPGSKGIPVQVVLPGGTLRVLAFGLAVESAPEASRNGPPYAITVNVRYPDAAAAAAALQQQAGALGLPAETLAVVRQRGQAPTFGTTVLSGLWLQNFTVQVDARAYGSGTGEVLLNYLFTFVDAASVSRPAGQTPGPALPRRPAH